MNSVLTLLIVCSQLLIIHSYWMFDEDQDSESPFLQTRSKLAPGGSMVFQNHTHIFKLCPKNIKCLEIQRKHKLKFSLGYEITVSCEGCYKSNNKKVSHAQESTEEAITMMRSGDGNFCYKPVQKSIGCKCPFN